MRETKLILVEGLPGSGRSTTAHTVARHLTRLGVPARWWYEEDDRGDIARMVITGPELHGGRPPGLLVRR